jgi:hypothetical protein
MYRSKLEERLAKSLENKGVPFLYEPESYEYTLVSRYKPDFHLPNGVIIESKGFFPPSDRRKTLAIIKQYPDLDLRFVFQTDQKLSKKSKLTYGSWCDKHSILWCVYPHIPDDWLP